jgi:single-stranded DNA-binding protein
MLWKNRITLIGFPGQHAETRCTPNSTVYTRFWLAKSLSWKDKGSTDYNTRTEWHRVIG